MFVWGFISGVLITLVALWVRRTIQAIRAAEEETEGERVSIPD